MKLILFMASKKDLDALAKAGAGWSWIGPSLHEFVKKEKRKKKEGSG